MKPRILVVCAFILCAGCGVFAQENFQTNMRVSLHKNRGTFRVMSVNQAGVTNDLLDYYNEGASSFFAVKVGRAVYKLQRMNVDGERIEDGGGKLAYFVSNKVSVDIDFLPVSSRNNDFFDMLKVKATVKNIGKSGDTFAFKAVFDTTLGEASGNHFSTASNSQINYEAQYTNMYEQKYISSSNGTDTINFLLYGENVTMPSAVTLGVKDSILANGVWLPVVTSPRPFNSVVAYNNSAVSVNWADKYLEADESFSVEFYIAIGTDGKAAATRVPSSQYEDVVVSAPTSLFDVEYIRGLLMRIEEIEMDGGNTNIDEITHLNEELDRILGQLRR